MFVKPVETVPASQLHGHPWPRGAMLSGVTATLVAHALVIGLAYLASHLTPDNPIPKSYIEERVVEARLVQIGKKPEKRRLPQRKVPVKATAPEQSVAVARDPKPKPEPPKRKPKPKPPQPTEEDLLSRLGDRAKAFAEIAEAREREGDPDGDPEGTDTESQAGDRYAAQLTQFFKRGWTIPTTLGDTSQLSAAANVTITRDLHIGGFTIVRKSGEPLFDASIEQRFNDLQSLGTTLPEPPIEVAHKFLGQTITVNFTDKK